MYIDSITILVEESLDKLLIRKHYHHTIAEVAELVDALGSGSSGGFPVEVRVFSSAPNDQRAALMRLQPFSCLILRIHLSCAQM